MVRADWVHIGNLFGLIRNSPFAQGAEIPWLYQFRGPQPISLGRLYQCQGLQHGGNKTGDPYWILAAAEQQPLLAPHLVFLWLWDCGHWQPGV